MIDELYLVREFLTKTTKSKLVKQNLENRLKELENEDAKYPALIEEVKNCLNILKKQPKLNRDRLLKPKVCLCKYSSRDDALNKICSFKSLKKILRAAKTKTIVMLRVLSSGYFINYMSAVRLIA